MRKAESLMRMEVSEAGYDHCSQRAQYSDPEDGGESPDGLDVAIEQQDGEQATAHGEQSCRTEDNRDVEGARGGNRQRKFVTEPGSAQAGGQKARVLREADTA